MSIPNVLIEDKGVSNYRERENLRVASPSRYSSATPKPRVNSVKTISLIRVGFIALLFTIAFSGHFYFKNLYLRTTHQELEWQKRVDELKDTISDLERRIALTSQYANIVSLAKRRLGMIPAPSSPETLWVDPGFPIPNIAPHSTYPHRDEHSSSSRSSTDKIGLNGR